MKQSVWWLVVILLVMSASGTLVRAQSSTGAVCVETFADLNADGLQQQSEAYLPGVNVNLATGGAIIATHVTAAGETGYCFENLLRGAYTVTFTDAPTFRMTTPHEGTFILETGQRLTVNPFGAVPVPPEQLRAEVAARNPAEQDQPLDTTTRLLLATGGSALVMMLMVGIGAVLLGLFSRRGRKSVPPPPRIAPPPR